MRYIFVLIMLTLFGCGSETTMRPDGSSPNGPDIGSQVGEINRRISMLMLVTGSLNSIINSDFSTCPLTGGTADPLINKICQVAQAATVEVRVQLQDQIGIFVNQLQSEITANQTDLAAQQAAIDAATTAIAANGANIAMLQSQIAAANAQIASINATLTNVQSDIVTLQSQMVSANAAISALQTLTNSINGALDGVMTSITIGDENLGAGPYYEALLRRVDKTRVNGYVRAVSAFQNFGSNAVTAVSGSATVTFSLTSHGYTAGDTIELSGLTSGRGFLTGDLQGQFVINSVTNANTFTAVLARAATSSGTLGGSVGIVRKINAQGMATLWSSSQASDAAVRQTNAGTKVYNFIIRRISTDLTNSTAEICYDRTNNAASFATINAASVGGSGNIVCK